MGVKSRLRVAAAGLGLAFVLAIALGATGVLAPNQRVAFGASTTLTIITGPVFVRHAPGEFGPADDGSILGPGDTVKTGPGSRAVLTYFEGSTVEIEPDSQITIDTAHANPDGSTVVVMQQDLGTTWHVVTHLVTGGSKYEVHTTAATASVRGTQFTVGVDPDGTTTETTTEGVVGNSDAQGASTVLTPPGQRTTTKKGETPAPPQPAPEPERKVDITLGDQNTLVVDTFGRANGIKDGKKILQTPGAQLEIVDGHLVIHLPNLPDGALTTHFLGTSGSTDVTTTVTEKGKSPVTVTGSVQAASNSGVDIKKGDGSNAPTVEKKTDKKDVPAPKVGQVPPVPVEVPVTTDNNGNGVDNSKGNDNNSNDNNSNGNDNSKGNDNKGSTNAGAPAGPKNDSGKKVPPPPPAPGFLPVAPPVPVGGAGANPGGNGNNNTGGNAGGADGKPNPGGGGNTPAGGGGNTPAGGSGGNTPLGGGGGGNTPGGGGTGDGGGGGGNGASGGSNSGSHGFLPDPGLHFVPAPEPPKTEPPKTEPRTEPPKPELPKTEPPGQEKKTHP